MKALLAEDDREFRDLLQTMLGHWGFEVVVAADGYQAWEILEADDPPQIALLDWIMPGMSGYELCRKIRDKMNEPYVYVILVTAQQREEDLVAGMEAGADDYIFKPLRLNELRVRLRAGRRIIELQNELVTAREILRKKASQDPLTGLWNHEEILGILRHELARAEREGGCVSVIMSDLDRFKSINDSYGHLAGDAVLLEVSRRMVTLARSYDFVGRYGGEEFLLVLPDCCRTCSIPFAERLRSGIAAEKIDTAEGQVGVTISLGIASRGRKEPRDAVSLIKAADAALYRAKHNGRNRIEIDE